MHSIHAVLIAVASLSAVLPAARGMLTPAAVHADATAKDPADLDDSDKDRNQNQDRDNDQDQDRDVSDVSQIFVAAESEQDDYLAPDLVLIVRPGGQSISRHNAATRSALHVQTTTIAAAPRPVYSRTCRLLL